MSKDQGNPYSLKIRPGLPLSGSKRSRKLGLTLVEHQYVYLAVHLLLTPSTLLPQVLQGLVTAAQASPASRGLPESV